MVLIILVSPALFGCPRKDEGRVVGVPVHVHEIDPPTRKAGERFTVRGEIQYAAGTCGQWVDIEFTQGADKVVDVKEEVFVGPGLKNYEFYVEVKSTATPGTITITARAIDTANPPIPDSAEVVP